MRRKIYLVGYSCRCLARSCKSSESCKFLAGKEILASCDSLAWNTMSSIYITTFTMFARYLTRLEFSKVLQEKILQKSY